MSALERNWVRHWGIFGIVALVLLYFLVAKPLFAWTFNTLKAELTAAEVEL